MGERVVINPAAAREPTPAVPLGYGHGGRRSDAWRQFTSTMRTAFGDAWRRLRPKLDEASNTLVAGFERLIALAGGWRQAGFAIGLAFICGGIGFAIADEAVLMMWLGGLLVGLTLRVGALKG
jgi:hypothetical protein